MRDNTDIKNEKALKEKFAARLKQCMLDLGYVSKKSPLTASASTLAKFAGVSRTMANRYLNGLAIPDINVLHKIADSLDCDVWWLLHGTKEKNKKPSGKISYDLAKFILLGLSPSISKTIDDNKKFSMLINDFVEIYNNISEIDADTSAKLKSAEIMVNFVNRNN